MAIYPPHQASGVAGRGPASLDAVLDRITMFCFQVSIVLFMVFGSIQVLGMNPLRPQTAHAAPAAPAAPITPKTPRSPDIAFYPYEANFNELSALVNNDWPQQVNNWCGIADLQVINDYAWWEVGKSSQNPYPTQGDMHTLLNSPAAESPWGYATYHDKGPGPYVAADIAADGGTDPRAIAWGLYTATPDPYFDHNYIYPGWNGVDNATRNFASDYGNNGLNNPITVAINGGTHMVMVSGVMASLDPSINPSTTVIKEVLVWDPAYPYGYNTTGVWQWWYTSDWENDLQWWGQPYNTNNGYDPDPSTTTLDYYNPPPDHWNGNYVTIEEDSIPPTTYINGIALTENIALDQLGNPVNSHGQ